jgi:hypothetical protein
MAQPGIDFFCSFSLFAQRKKPKERAPVSLGPSGILRALKSAGSLKTRCARTVQTPEGPFHGAQLRANGN